MTRAAEEPEPEAESSSRPDRPLPPPRRARVVADVNVLVQAFLSSKDPAARVLDLAWQAEILLVVSRDLTAELRETLAKPRLQSRFGYAPEAASLHVEETVLLGEIVADVPRVFDYPRDPDDAYLVDLAVAADARLITSVDNDLLDLMADTPDGIAFRDRFPGLEVLTPPSLLARLSRTSKAAR